jgi:hypothetical protein
MYICWLQNPRISGTRNSGTQTPISDTQSDTVAKQSPHTQTHRHTDTQTLRHTDTQTHRHTDTQTHRHTDTQTQTQSWTRYDHEWVSEQKSGKPLHSQVHTTEQMRQAATNKTLRLFSRGCRHIVMPVYICPPVNITSASPGEGRQHLARQRLLFFDFLDAPHQLLSRGARPTTTQHNRCRAASRYS